MSMFLHHRELRWACAGLMDEIQAQVDGDDQLTDTERATAPVAALQSALAADSVADLIRAGRSACEWIIRNASDEEREDWALNCPHPDIDGFELAVATSTRGAEAQASAPRLRSR